jgi:hypothetical protein
LSVVEPPSSDFPDDLSTENLSGNQFQSSAEKEKVFSTDTDCSPMVRTTASDGIINTPSVIELPALVSATADHSTNCAPRMSSSGDFISSTSLSRDFSSQLDDPGAFIQPLDHHSVPVDSVAVILNPVDVGAIGSLPAKEVTASLLVNNQVFSGNKNSSLTECKPTSDAKTCEIPVQMEQAPVSQVIESPLSDGSFDDDFDFSSNDLEEIEY